MCDEIWSNPEITKEPQTPNLKSGAPNPTHETPNLKPQQTPNPTSQTLTPKRHAPIRFARTNCRSYQRASATFSRSVTFASRATRYYVILSCIISRYFYVLRYFCSRICQNGLVFGLHVRANLNKLQKLPESICSLLTLRHLRVKGNKVCR